MRWISSLAEDLLASQDGPGSMDFIIIIIIIIIEQVYI